MTIGGVLHHISKQWFMNPGLTLLSNHVPCPLDVTSFILTYNSYYYYFSNNM